MSIYFRPPTESYKQRAAARRAQEPEKRRPEPQNRSEFFDLPASDRRRIRRAEEAGKAEAERLARIEEAAKQAANGSTRPHNPWRELITMRKPDAWRKDVARRIRVYEREAKLEDERIDKLIAEEKKREELESAPEYSRALAHWERLTLNASDEEQEQLARLKGLLEGGCALQYYDAVAPLVQARLQKIQADIAENAAKQSPMAEEARTLATALQDAEQLQEADTDTSVDKPTCNK